MQHSLRRFTRSAFESLEARDMLAGDVSLTIGLLEVIDKAKLDGEGGIDTLIDEGDSQIGNLITNFEL